MMKKQVTLVATLLILVALSSNLDIVAEVQLGSGPYKKLDTINCYDSCSTGCAGSATKKLIKCEHKGYVRCGGTGG